MTDQSDTNLKRTNERLADIGRRRFEKDHLIFREHESGDNAFIIAEGKVEILRETSEGPMSVRILHKGAMFGEMALIDDKPRMASARATKGPVELLLVNRKKFQQKLGQLDPFSRGLINILTNTCRDLADKAVNNILYSESDK